MTGLENGDAERAVKVRQSNGGTWWMREIGGGERQCFVISLDVKPPTVVDLNTAGGFHRCPTDPHNSDAHRCRCKVTPPAKPTKSKIPRTLFTFQIIFCSGSQESAPGPHIGRDTGFVVVTMLRTSSASMAQCAKTRGSARTQVVVLCKENPGFDAESREENTKGGSSQVSMCASVTTPSIFNVGKTVPKSV